MGLTKLVEESFEGLGRLGRIEFFHALLSFVLFLDIYLALRHDKSVVTLDYAWLKQHLDIGEILIFLMLLSFLLAVVLPFVRSCLVGLVMCGGLISSFFHKATLEANVVKSEDLMAYAILNNNSVAYQECIRRGTVMGDTYAYRARAFAVIIFIITDLMVGLRGDSVALEFLSWLEGLPALASASLKVFLMFTLLGAAVDAIFGSRLERKGFIFGNLALSKELNEMRRLHNIEFIEEDKAA